MKEEELLHSYFTEKDITGITAAEFQVAMVGLIEKGLMEMIEQNGMKFYRPTPLARKMKSHLNSSPKNQN